MSTTLPKAGRMTIFLGYAAGVGKTYRMLGEAHALAERGTDVVIGYFEPHARPDTIALAQKFDAVPRKPIEYRNCQFEEMDTDAILARRPQLCVVDEFAHTNVPTSPRQKRWEDVMVLLAAGIDVFTNMNVQHLESLNDQVWQISGVRVRETIPDWVVRQADELVMVDLSTRALLNRLQRGVIYAPGKAQAAMENFFREPTLVALRELALRQSAHEIELRQQQSREVSVPPIFTGPGPASRGDRILVFVTAEPSAAMILRRGWRVANYLRAECFAVAVTPPGRSGGVVLELDRHLAFARNLRIQTQMLTGADVPATLVEFAHRHAITQLFVARPHLNPASRAQVARIVDLARDLQVNIVAPRRRSIQ